LVPILDARSTVRLTWLAGREAASRWKARLLVSAENEIVRFLAAYRPMVETDIHFRMSSEGWRIHWESKDLMAAKKKIASSRRSTRPIASPIKMDSGDPQPPK
jgi:hypothetical protein